MDFQCQLLLNECLGDYKTFLVKFFDDVTINAYTKTNYKFLCDVKTIIYGSFMVHYQCKFQEFHPTHLHVAQGLFWSLKNDTQLQELINTIVNVYSKIFPFSHQVVLNHNTSTKKPLIQVVVQKVLCWMIFYLIDNFFSLLSLCSLIVSHYH